MIEKELLGTVHGCFRCGEIGGDFELDEQGFCICSSCGERSIVSFQQALDLLNDFYLHNFNILVDPEQQEDLENDGQ